MILSKNDLIRELHARKEFDEDVLRTAELVEEWARSAGYNPVLREIIDLTKIVLAERARREARRSGSDGQR